MRLLHFKEGGSCRLGVQTELGVVDVSRAASALGVAVPTTLEAIFSEGLTRLAAFVESAAVREAGAPWLRDEAGLAFAPCVPRAGKILCIGLNYRAHAAESRVPVPKTPVIFAKFSNALSGHLERILLPTTTEQYDYEAELVVVIRTRCKYVPEARAAEVVFGYCNGNDLSARDVQLRTSQWVLGKTFDQFFPIGPYLVTADGVPNPPALGLRCFLNGERRQHANTGDMVFTIPQLISHISQYLTLEPGDVISTGTPEGVINETPDKRWIKPGDEVAVEIDGLGRLTNVFEADSPLHR